ncbi:P-loop containing nucleoside triphosphate hydrolase protein [Dichomitus squalens]|uniref:P-loop containing nucleoside triphosphate hydrolase protein n=1 Tax=Dichomitus squalens TaxID=114155 RepID=A0A4Q9PH43_9APHY|nr:P-loop containing nucleoside triphosphate hydrolase protein [Dichomitus squalens]
MDNPGGTGAERLPPESQPRDIHPFDRESRHSIESPSKTNAMFSIYDLVLTLDVLALLVLFAVTIPVVPPHFPSRERRIYPWLFYGARIAAFALVLGMMCLPRRWRTRFSIPRNIILLAIWAVYAYRDIWPLATYDLTPIDGAEGNLLWAKIGLLTLAAIVLPLISPRHTDDLDARPEQRASIFSLVTYGWLDPLIWRAQHLKHLPFEELPPLAEYNSTDHLVETSYALVDPMRVSDDRSKSRDVAWGLARLFSPDLLVMGIMVILASASSFLTPLGLKHILSHVEQGSQNETFKPWFWILALLFGSMGVSMCMQYYHYVSTQVVARTQAILTQLMYDVALMMRPKATTNAKTAPGKPQDGKGAMPLVQNLVTTDLTNVTNASTFVLLVLFETPIHIVLSVVFLYSILGWSTFVGVAVMVALFPVPTELSKRTKGLQGAKARASDRRVTLVIQMLDMIRTIKFLAWEPEQAEKLGNARLEELRAIRKVNMMQIWIGAINVCIPLLIMLASYATFTLGMKRELSASIVFSSISLFEILRSQLGLIFFRIPILTNGKVSLERINRFLKETELLDRYTKKGGNVDHLTENGHSLETHATDIGFRDAHFTWTEESAQDQPFTLKIDRELLFKKGGLNIIYGPTASGKTSLLVALLGEMHYRPQNGSSFVSLPVEEGVAYAAQESWVMAASVRDNILFGQPYDEDRYYHVIEACALDEDIDEFEHKDETLVGERGILLSGGQRARLTLARAVYSKAQILLLDDILSEIDNSTIQHIVRHVFRGDLLKGRTVILATNNVKAVLPIATWAVQLGHNGTVVDAGPPPQDLIASSATPSATPNGVHVKSSRADRKAGADQPVQQQQVAPEETQEGHVGWKPMSLLFGNMSKYPILFWIVLLSSLLLASVVINAQIWLLGYWASQYSDQPASRVSVVFFLAIYVTLLIGSLLTDAVSRMVHLAGTLEASAKIHSKLANSILGATLRWLDYTPKSRVVARFTDDIGASKYPNYCFVRVTSVNHPLVDGQISNFLLKLLELSTSMLVRLVLVLVVAPIFTVAVLLFGIISGIYARAYMKAQLPVKREQSKTRAPLIGHLNSTVASLVSIRAYGVQKTFQNDMHDRIDRWTRASNTFYNLNRWVIVRADLVGTIFTVSLATYLTYFTKLNASNIGFSLNMAIAFSSKVFEFVRTLNTFEVSVYSLERIQQYLVIEQEDMSEPDAIPQAEGDWPADGSLDVEDLSAWYTLDGPEILKRVTFSIKSGELIGIVGRTGSGKSTLTLALLRCIPTNIRTSSSPEATGDVVYSGKSIGMVGLRTLRKKITIIPQIPELFQGTIRQNLDPFGKYRDAELGSALLGAQGIENAQETVTDTLTLDTQVSSGGKNLSAGQRQIVALARAIVRKSKLLVMDEGTWIMNNESNAKIQLALRKQLDHKVTVITVAHRLSTIKDYDKVLVLDAGSVVEFDSPINLLRKENGRFRELVDQASAEERQLIRAAVGLVT